MRLDDALRNREPYAQPAGLTGHERLEQRGFHVDRDATTRVADAERNETVAKRSHDQSYLAGFRVSDRLAGVQDEVEQYLLDLEREAFVSLCGERKTLERIQSILTGGKPLRN